MDSNKVVIPEGWTYFAHRTNTANWDTDPFNTDLILIKKIMSVVTERDIYCELRSYGKNHLLSYSTGKGEPFEIRCLICDLMYLRNLENFEVKDAMLKEFYYDRRNFGGCYGQRHHSIPPKEELVVIGVGNYDEVFERETKIIWTIPRRFLEFYKTELLKENSRVIDTDKSKGKAF